MKQTKFNQDDAIMRFKESHLGFAPADTGHIFIDEYDEYYVYAKTQESLKTFFKFEKNNKAFKIGVPILLLLFMAISVWIIITPLLINIVILWLIALLLFAKISYVIYHNDTYLPIVRNNIILVKKL